MLDDLDPEEEDSDGSPTAPEDAEIDEIDWLQDVLYVCDDPLEIPGIVSTQLERIVAHAAEHLESRESRASRFRASEVGDASEWRSGGTDQEFDLEDFFADL